MDKRQEGIGYPSTLNGNYENKNTKILYLLFVQGRYFSFKLDPAQDRFVHRG